jgi:ribosomal protein S18 acetylase RimI-like enzyme
VTEVDAHELLEEYFSSRGISTLGYVIKHPDPANFIAPDGVFLVVDDDEGPVGCGGIRRLDAARYEVKHVWIRPRARGLGLGRRLLTELERRAIELGATYVVLDTNASQVEAGSLYRSAGYESIEPYNENPNATHWFSKAVRSEDPS